MDSGALSGGADVAMRRMRASRYSTYSVCSASRRSFESVRNPALRAFNSSFGRRRFIVIVVVGWVRDAALIRAFDVNGKCVRRCEVANCLESVSSTKPLHFGRAAGGP